MSPTLGLKETWIYNASGSAVQPTLNPSSPTSALNPRTHLHLLARVGVQQRPRRNPEQVRNLQPLPLPASVTAFLCRRGSSRTNRPLPLPLARDVRRRCTEGLWRGLRPRRVQRHKRRRPLLRLLRPRRHWVALRLLLLLLLLLLRGPWLLLSVVVATVGSGGWEGRLVVKPPSATEHLGLL